MFRHSDTLRTALFALCGTFVALGQGANTLADVLHVRAGTSGPQTGGSWAEAFDDLQSALSAVQAGDEIWVARGVYRPGGSGDRLATFELISGVALYGGFDGTETDRRQRNPDPETNGTVLSGDLAEDDGPDEASNGENSFHVVSAFSTDATAVLDGFTIRGGNANGSFPDESGAGLVNVDASPAIVNCLFVGNSAGSANEPGFGAAVLNDTSSPVLTHCIFRANTVAGGSGGAIANLASSPTLVGCTFTENSAGDHGGAMFSDFSDVVLRDCTFRNNVANAGGAIHDTRGAGRQSTLTMTDCTFIANTAIQDGGAVHTLGAIATLTNCTFQGNSAGMDADDEIANQGVAAAHPVEGGGFGGAIMFQLGLRVSLTNCVFSGNVASQNGGAVLNCCQDPTYTNCTISGNFAGGGGGGMTNTDNASPVLTNCIIWGNSDSVGSDSGAQVYSDDVGSNRPTVNYSCVQGGWAGRGGVGIIEIDPLFRRAPDDGGDGWGVGDNDDFGDLRLRSGSPAIDAGDNTADIDLRQGGLQPLPEVDLDGNPRRLDDLATPDTGNPVGDAPIVDLGAFEFVLATVPGDLDGDGDVDLSDYLALLGCVGGPGQPLAAGCEDADLDGDGDSDLGDVVRFQGLFTGGQ